METKFKDISRDPQTGDFTTCIAVKLADRSVRVLKAKAKLYAGVMNGMGQLVEEKLADFERRPK